MTGLAIALAVVILTAISIALFRRLASRLDAEACTTEWLENFSTANYAPMRRLFDEKDFEFLASQPGYLQLLIRDFNQLHAIAKLMLVYSDEDRPDFGQALFWQQITFYYAVTAVRCRLALMPLGWTAPDVRTLIQP